MNLDLDQMLRSKSKRDFDDAITAMRQMPLEQAIQRLEHLCMNDDFEIRCKGIDGLAKIAPHHAESVALRMLSDIDPTVRWWAVYWLGILQARSGSGTAIGAFTKVLVTDPDDLVRSEVAAILGDIGDSSVLFALEEVAKKDPGTNHEGVPIKRTARAAIEKIMRRRST